MIILAWALAVLSIVVACRGGLDLARERRALKDQETTATVDEFQMIKSLPVTPELAAGEARMKKQLEREARLCHR